MRKCSDRSSLFEGLFSKEVRIVAEVRRASYTSLIVADTYDESDLNVGDLQTDWIKQK